MAANAAPNDKRASWASEVEEDEEATGWDEPVQATTGDISYPEGPSKPRKNKKKKKNKTNANAVQAKQDSTGSTYVEAEFKNLSVGLSQSQTASQTVHTVPPDFDGWQLANSRKTKQVPPAYNMPPPVIHGPSSPWPPSSPSPSPSPSSSSFRPEPARLGRIPPMQRFDNPGSFGGQQAGHTGSTSTSNINGHSEGFALRGVNGGIPQWRVSDVASQRSRTFSEVSKVTPAAQNINQVDRMNTKHVADGAQAQTQARAWGKLPPVSAINEARKSQEIDNIFSQLLPSERAEIGVPSPASFGTLSQTGSKSNNRVAYPVPELIEPPIRADSDSALSDIDLDDDSDWMGSDEDDSDASVKSLETRKKNKWFHSFFDTLDEFTNEQIMEHDRQWHCPACHGGVGAIDWYRGLQPLLAHAKTHRTKRIRLHREFAKVLEEELDMRRAGTSASGETKFGKWKGLRNADATMDEMIIWPPMVVIQNTQLTQDEQDKWTGMGNKELLDMFKHYSPVRSRHSYGPQGHRGMSVLIFAESPTGYYHAERLAKAFKDAGKSRDQWDVPGKRVFQSGGDRILYGYMANAEDMDIFNRHHAGKSKVKWELKRYKEAVAEPLSQMDKDNRQLHYLKVKMQQQKEQSRILKKSMSMFSRKLQQREEEIAIIRQLARDQYEEYQREMDDLERTYKERSMQLQKNILKREQEVWEKKEEVQQGHIERCQQLEKKLGEEQQQPKQAKVQEDIARQTELVESSLRETEEYEYKKQELMKQQYIRKTDFKRKQFEQALEFDRELEKERQELLDHYSKNVESTS